MQVLGTVLGLLTLLTGFASAQPSQLISPHDIRQQALLQLCREQVRARLNITREDDMGGRDARDALAECLHDHRAGYVIPRRD